MESSSVAATAAETAAAPLPRARRRPVFLLRWGLPVAYVVVLAVASVVRGLPTSRDALFVWVVLGLLAASAAGSRRRLRRLLADWLPFGAILFAYDLLRGYADSLFAAHVLPQLRADEILFGGTAPTVWLQQRLWDGPAHLDWIDYAAWCVYLSHFFATLVCAAVLWLVAPQLFRRYIAAVSVLAAAGFATYALFPAVPPWMAARDGHLEHVDRIVRFVSRSVPVDFFGAIWEKGERYANDVAAVPSLHAAYALLIALIFWRVAGWRWRIVLAAYPVAMGFALVYTGEHYAVDVLLGWLYAVGALALVDLVRRRWERT
jgi:membrane-associated phospholipid phosphatase